MRWSFLLMLVPLSAGATQPAKITLSSSAFQSGAAIPMSHTCDDKDRSPALAWSKAPAATKSYVLIADDPDAPAGTWVHWVLYDIPPERTSLEEALATDPKVPGVGVQGKNDFGKVGYGGPCPPGGQTHRYFFKLYALDTKLDLPPGATKAEVEQKMSGHVIGQGELIGKYARHK
jgi:Raf kinase inhibitor-like YbhB/YbcL family protein